MDVSHHRTRNSEGLGLDLEAGQAGSSRGIAHAIAEKEVSKQKAGNDTKGETK